MEGKGRVLVHYGNMPYLPGGYRENYHWLRWCYGYI